jgi:hypothetical protein
MIDRPRATLAALRMESIAVRNYLEALERSRRTIWDQGARDSIDLTALESEFVAAAYSYAQRRGICFAAWREVGVDEAVLRKAGITDSMERSSDGVRAAWSRLN